MSRKGGKPVVMAMVVTALVVTPMVLFGVYLGYYVADLAGYSKPILAIVFSTIGFLVAMVIVTKAIVRIVARTGSPKA